MLRQHGAHSFYAATMFTFIMAFGGKAGYTPLISVLV